MEAYSPPCEDRALMVKTEASHSNDHTADRPLNVIHIIKHCGSGNGNVHVAVDLACVQARSGYKVNFVSGGGTFEPLLQKCGVRHIKLPHEQNKPLALLRCAWIVASIARSSEGAVLHAHMMSSALVGFAASKLSGTPLVTTVHNSFDRHSLLMRLGRKVVAVSEAERKHLLERGYKNKQVIAVMNAPNNSPRADFMRGSEYMKLDSPCILAANGLHRRKGVGDIISACESLFRNLPDWKLYIAGEGPDREILEQQAAIAGIADRVIFLGFIPDPGLLLRQADIFVLASYADPCSLVIGEARAAGCAIVATKVGGTPEMLDFGRAGRLVPPGDPTQLAAELRDLMLDSHMRQELGRKALHGSEVFDVSRLVADYRRVYLEALQQ